VSGSMANDPYISADRFAEQILFGETLASKLTPPSPSLLTYATRSPDPVVSGIPLLPCRPEGLEIGRNKKSDARHAFPSRSSLDLDRSRGLVLHFFANHELLALELMAVAILKFRDAEEPFVRGIVRTMAEEQLHLAQYIARMSELGVEFGEAPLNGFFWSLAAQMTTPMHYAAVMSLTFEQANLDFSLHFERLFSKVGDLPSANLMAKVRLEEIGHVKHGVVWLRKWKDESLSMWEQYRRLLEFPLTPMRAKGPLFDRDGRLAAGLDEEFIRQVRIYSASKGRPPKVFFFNPMCDDEIAFDLKKNQSDVIKDVVNDLAPLMMHFGHADDVVLVDTLPSVKWLESQVSCGFVPTEFVEVGSLGLVEPDRIRTAEWQRLCERQIDAIYPWGFTTALKKAFSSFSVAGFEQAVTTQNLEEILRTIFSKSFASTLRTPNDLTGFVCSTIDELKASLTQLDAGRCVLKCPLSSAGREKRVFDWNGQLIDLDVVLKLASSKLEIYPNLLLEKWVNRVADFSLQGEILNDGTVRSLGTLRCMVSSTGQYKGHFLGKLAEGLDVDIATRWYQGGDSWESCFESALQRAGAALFNYGYRGFFGIDGFLYRLEDGALKFQSLSEINPRRTMGQVALKLQQQIVNKRPAVWLHLTRRDIAKKGFKDFVEFESYASKEWPLVIDRGRDDQLRISSGALFTTDPSRAKQVVTMLIVGRDYEELAKVQVNQS
jgi:uncharacterized ferritin-like protein (DUF455 family)